MHRRLRVADFLQAAVVHFNQLASRRRRSCRHRFHADKSETAMESSLLLFTGVRLLDLHARRSHLFRGVRHALVRDRR